MCVLCVCVRACVFVCVVCVCACMRVCVYVDMCFIWVIQMYECSPLPPPPIPPHTPGYNHPVVLKALSNPSNLVTLASRPALGMFPSVDFPQLLENSLLSVSCTRTPVSAITSPLPRAQSYTSSLPLRQVVPKDLPEVTTMMCGTCSNENAFKAAFIQYMASRTANQPLFVMLVRLCAR